MIEVGLWLEAKFLVETVSVPFDNSRHTIQGFTVYCTVIINACIIYNQSSNLIVET